VSMILLRQLNDSRNTIAVQTRAILERAESEKRDLTADEDAQFRKGTDDMIAIGERVKEVLRNAEAERTLNEQFARFGGRLDEADERAGDKGADAEVRSFLRGERRALEVTAPMGAAKRAQAIWRTGHEARALAKSASSVKVSFYDQLIQHLVDTTSVLGIANVWETATGEAITVPITTSHGASAGLTAEGAAFTGTDPTLNNRSLGAYKYPQLVTVSSELVTDASFDILGYVAEMAGRNIGLSFGTDIAVGNGSSKPSGVVQTASTGKTGSASVAGAFSADDLIDLQYSVIAPYRNSPSCAWLVRDATLAAIRKLKDGAGRYLFDTQNLPTMSPADGTILGKPVFTDPNIAAVALSAKSVVFGDFSKFVVRLAGGVRFERSDDYAFNSDQVTFRAILRGDSILVDQTGAVKVFVGNAA